MSLNSKAITTSTFLFPFIYRLFIILLPFEVNLVIQVNFLPLKNLLFQGKIQTAVLVQAKPMDVTRLYERIGEVSKGDYRKIMSGFLGLFQYKNMP